MSLSVKTKQRLVTALANKSAADELESEIASGGNDNVLLRDGSVPMTGNLDLGNNGLVNLSEISKSTGTLNVRSGDIKLRLSDNGDFGIGDLDAANHERYIRYLGSLGAEFDHFEINGAVKLNGHTLHAGAVNADSSILVGNDSISVPSVTPVPSLSLKREIAIESGISQVLVTEDQDDEKVGLVMQTYHGSTFKSTYVGSFTDHSYVTGSNYKNQLYLFPSNRHQLFGDDTGIFFPRNEHPAALSIFVTAGSGNEFLRAIDENDNVRFRVANDGAIELQPDINGSGGAISVLNPNGPSGGNGPYTFSVNSAGQLFSRDLHTEDHAYIGGAVMTNHVRRDPPTGSGPLFFDVPDTASDFRWVLSDSTELMRLLGDGKLKLGSGPDSTIFTPASPSLVVSNVDDNTNIQVIAEGSEATVEATFGVWGGVGEKALYVGADTQHALVLYSGTFSNFLIRPSGQSMFAVNVQPGGNFRTATDAVLSVLADSNDALEAFKVVDENSTVLAMISKAGVVNASGYEINGVAGIDHVEVINGKTFTWDNGILTSVV